VAGVLEIAADGTIAIPEAPGTGIDLDPESLTPWLTESWRRTR